jgi:hypothetical protein
MGDVLTSERLRGASSAMRELGRLAVEACQAELGDRLDRSASLEASSHSSRIGEIATTS